MRQWGGSDDKQPVQRELYRLLKALWRRGIENERAAIPAECDNITRYQQGRNIRLQGDMVGGACVCQIPLPVPEGKNTVLPREHGEPACIRKTQIHLGQSSDCNRVHVHSDETLRLRPEQPKQGCQGQSFFPGKPADQFTECLYGIWNLGDRKSPNRAILA